jgi:predicted nucleotidyltransferase
MHPVIATKREEIETLCRRFHVRRLEVFGSVATGRFDPNTSDVDLLVEFEAGPLLDVFDAYFGLKEGLEALLGRPVDLVISSAVTNPYFRESIERTRAPLYAP